MESSYSNEELMHLISLDNEEAFTELYNRFWESLFAIAYNRLKDLQAAEDIVHDIFTSIWNNRHNIKAVCLKSYLASAVKYMVLAQLKKKQYARKYSIEAGAATIDETDMERSIHYRSILNMVNEEVNLLPEKCKLIFKYSRQNGMSTKEIAVKLHISPKTVDNQLNKALHHLRLKMKHMLTNFLFLFF